MHKIFISYHHRLDQDYKESLLSLNDTYNIFIDGSVDTRDIDDELPDETIRQKIRDEFLRDTTVTVLLVGIETQRRKHIDWEIYSSMFNGTVNKQSGLVIINLPSTGCTSFTAAHTNEKEKIYPDCTGWCSIETKAAYRERYPYLPDRIIDNLHKTDTKISVTSWDRCGNDPEALRLLIENAALARSTNKYDMTAPMRRNNS